MTIAEKLLRAKTDIDEVYTAGVEAGKAQGGGIGEFTLYGNYMLKEPITPEDTMGLRGFDESFPADSVYAYFYDIKINDYVYLPVESIIYNDKIYHWYATNSKINHNKELRDGKWAYYWYDETTDEIGEGLYPDIKGRIIAFEKPVTVSEAFYNLFMATTIGDEEIYDEGKQSEYDRFWGAYQENGERTDYRNAFVGYYWNKETLRPKYTCKVVGNGGGAMFSQCYWRTPVTDPNDLFDISNIPIDVTEATDCGSMFANAKVDNVRLIFGDKITSLNTAFTKGGGGNIAGMHITLLVPNPNCDWTNAFSYHNVKELNLLDGTVIGTNGFNVRWATGLSKANIKSIIFALSKSTSGLSITLSQTAVDIAFAESITPKAVGGSMTPGSSSIEWQTLVATKPNWTINLA